MNLLEFHDNFCSSLARLLHISSSALAFFLHFFYDSQQNLLVASQKFSVSSQIKTFSFLVVFLEFLLAAADAVWRWCQNFDLEDYFSCNNNTILGQINMKRKVGWRWKRKVFNHLTNIHLLLLFSLWFPTPPPTFPPQIRLCTCKQMFLHSRLKSLAFDNLLWWLFEKFLREF